MATQLLSCWGAITDIRRQGNGWTTASSDPALKEYFEIVSRNVHRARVRLTLEKYRGQLGWDTTPKGADGNIITDPFQ